jgi:mRNA-degrading endonuclease RelE of RelBE toxin-antitoxin system
MIWRVNLHLEAAKQLEKIPPDGRRRILADIDQLAEDKAVIERFPVAIASSSDQSTPLERLRCCSFYFGTNALTDDV